MSNLTLKKTEYIVTYHFKTGGTYIETYDDYSAVLNATNIFKCGECIYSYCRNWIPYMLV